MNSLRLVTGISALWLLQASSTVVVAIQLVLHKLCFGCDFEEHVSALVDP